jgi:hypothetical protein
MDPKSGKPLRLFNPFSIWLKSGEAMLAAAQAAVARPKARKVAVIREKDASPPRKATRAKSGAKAKKARKNASSRGRRRGR